MAMKKNPTWQKTISWMIVSSIMIAGCAWFASGSLIVGLMAAFWANFIKLPLYYAHEAVWGRIIFGRGTVVPAPKSVGHLAQADDRV